MTIHKVLISLRKLWFILGNDIEQLTKVDGFNDCSTKQKLEAWCLWYQLDLMFIFDKPYI